MSTPRPPIKLTTTQAAVIAGVQPYVVRKWVHRGWVKRTRGGYIDGASLIAYLDNRGERGQHKRRR